MFHSVPAAITYPSNFLHGIFDSFVTLLEKSVLESLFVKLMRRKRPREPCTDILFEPGQHTLLLLLFRIH